MIALCQLVRKVILQHQYIGEQLTSRITKILCQGNFALVAYSIGWIVIVIKELIDL